VASALAVLEGQGYDTIVCNVDSPAERDRHLESLLPTHRADGVLAICLPLARGQLGQLARAGVALASVDAASPGIPQTVIDDVAGGRLATGHLIGLGHRRFGFVGDMPFGRPRPGWASPPRRTGCAGTIKPWPRPASTRTRA
jgi:DNA-binding LacI/PurR family transcriptional regulator